MWKYIHPWKHGYSKMWIYRGLLQKPTVEFHTTWIIPYSQFLDSFHITLVQTFIAQYLLSHVDCETCTCLVTTRLLAFGLAATTSRIHSSTTNNSSSSAQLAFNREELLGIRGGMPFVGVFLRDLNPYLHLFRKKNTENFDWVGRQTWPEIGLSTFHLPVLSTKPVCHWWR